MSAYAYGPILNVVKLPEARPVETPVWVAREPDVLAATPIEKEALLALDADPERRWYEFTVELAQLPQGQSPCAPLGIFFGWAPLLFTSVFYALEVLVAFLQAYVFAILACLYLNDALHMH